MICSAIASEEFYTVFSEDKRFILPHNLHMYSFTVKFPGVFLSTTINLLSHVSRSLHQSRQYRFNCLLQGSISPPKFLITDSLTNPCYFSHFPSLFFLWVWFSLFCCILRPFQGFKYWGCTKTIWRNQKSFSTLTAEPNTANSAQARTLNGHKIQDRLSTSFLSQTRKLSSLALPTAASIPGETEGSLILPH